MASYNEAVDLLSSDEENTPPNAQNDAGRGAFRTRVKRVDGHDVLCLDISDSEDDDDDVALAPQAAGRPFVAALDPILSTVSEPRNKEEDIAVVAPPVAPTAGTSETNGQDEDVAIIGATGPNALADFPHSRENCVTYPSAKDPARHCPHCYCYICDNPASSCPVWQTHCHATHGDPKWRKMREDVRKNGGAIEPAPTPAAPRIVAPTAGMNPPPGPRSVAGRPDLDEYSLRALLQTITTVHPVELSPPTGVFTTELRHYQKQSYAFMLEEERRIVAEKVVLGGWLCDEVGMVSHA